MTNEQILKWVEMWEQLEDEREIMKFFEGIATKEPEPLKYLERFI